MGKNASLKVPESFEWNGWSKKNNYGLNKDDFENKAEYRKERFRRGIKVSGEWRKTDEGRRAASIVYRENWEERAAEAHRMSDTTEVLLLEALTKREDGITTSEMVANCINLIAKELAKRGAKGIEDLKLNELVLISNTLIGLMKTAAATKKEQGWKPDVQVNNVTINNNSSKTGGVIGGLQDVIDVGAENERKV